MKLKLNQYLFEKRIFYDKQHSINYFGIQETSKMCFNLNRVSILKCFFMFVPIRNFLLLKEKIVTIILIAFNHVNFTIGNIERQNKHQSIFPRKKNPVVFSLNFSLFVFFGKFLEIWGNFQVEFLEISGSRIF